MRRVCILLLFASTVACGSGSDPMETDSSSSSTKHEPPPLVTSGTFDVTAKVSFDGCDRTAEWDGTYDIDIDSTAFSMGSFTGSWDAKRVKARGETPHDRTTIRNCLVTIWTEVNITFTSEDAFYGSIIYRYRVAGECGTRNPCATTWLIHGTRQETVPAP